MIAALKDCFCEKLEEEPQSDVEATLWYVAANPPLQGEENVYLNWDDPESDEEEVPSDVFAS